MHGLFAMSLAVLVGVGSGGGCSSKQPEPPPSQAAAPPSEQRIPAGSSSRAAPDAAPRAAGAEPSKPPDPLAMRFPERYLPGKGLPDGMQRRIRYHLRDRTRAQIALDPIIDVPRPDGGRDVFAIYSYSRYEDCMSRYATRKEGRERCADEQGEPKRRVYSSGMESDHGRTEAVLVNECVALGAVRASFAPPGRESAGDLGGALTVSSIALPKTLCAVKSYPHLFVADVDGDKKLEMYIDIATTRVLELQTRHPDDYSVQRDLFIWDGGSSHDAALQLVFVDSTNPNPNLMSVAAEQELVELRDFDGDGHLDLIHLELIWPSGSDSEARLLAERQPQAVYLYDRVSDTWRATKPPAPKPDGSGAKQPGEGGAAPT